MFSIVKQSEKPLYGFIFFSILLLKWSNMNFKPPFQKFGIFRAFHILIRNSYSLPERQSESYSLEEFRSFYSLEFGEFIVPHAAADIIQWLSLSLSPYLLCVTPAHDSI